MSNVALAEKVHLSPPCLRRVERLKRLGLIEGWWRCSTPGRGAGMLVMIGVVLDRSTPESFAAFEKAAAKVSGCMECHVVTGEFDYFMLIRTRDSDELQPPARRAVALPAGRAPGALVHGAAQRALHHRAAAGAVACRYLPAARSLPITADHSGPPNTFTTSPAISSPAPAKCIGSNCSPNAKFLPAGGQTHHGQPTGEGATQFTG